MLKLLPQPAVIAHRGASAYAPENTLSSFQLAIEQNADAIEFDVRLSKDHQVVAIHDKEVNRTTDFRGKVRKLRLDDLKKMDAGSYYHPFFKNEKIPTLQEIISLFGNSTLFNIEIKNHLLFHTRLPKMIAQLISENELIENTLISSFNPLDLMVIRQTAPEIELGFLVPPGKYNFLSEIFFEKLINFDSIHFDFRDISKELVEKYHNKNKSVFAYTVNNIEDINELADYGIDGIFTDDPILVKQHIYAG